MKMRVMVVVSLVLAGASIGLAQIEATSKDPSVTALADAFVVSLEKEDFEDAVVGFDATMKQALPAPKLAATWRALLARTGLLKRRLGSRTQKIGPFTAVFVTCQFEKTTLDVKVVFNAAKQITGLWFVPTKPAAEYEPPTYVDLEAFREKEVQLGKPPWILPGTLSLPEGESPFPAVVLVHGSGPNDRDETIGPNKPFRDLAWGLASHGIAVLRYEKRTKVHAARLAALAPTFTVKEEVIDDVIAATSLLRRTEAIDARRIFVLGHSLGGMLIPRIAARDPEIAGLIVLAGATRRLEDAFLEQMIYVLSLDGLSDDDDATLSRIRDQVARVKALQPGDSVEASLLPLGIPAAYWLDLAECDPPRAAKALTQPMLILQGARDYQVTLAEFETWKTALSERPNVAFKLYPNLNHLFIAGKGKCTPQEYANPGNVEKTVIRDLAGWIKGP